MQHPLWAEMQACAICIIRELALDADAHEIYPKSLEQSHNEAE